MKKTLISTSIAFCLAASAYASANAGANGPEHAADESIFSRIITIEGARGYGLVF